MQTISIVSQKGGACKTTLAVHVATAATAAGLSTLIIDTDSQASASHWSNWRGEADPDVVHCGAPTLLERQVRQAKELGADLVVIDTPPHAEAMAREATKLAHLVLIPSKPHALDLQAASTTCALVRDIGRPAFLVFMCGPQRAPVTYAEATALVEGTDGSAGFGVKVAPVRLTQRAVYHHSMDQGKVAGELEPEGKAAEEVAALWKWVCRHIDVSSRRHVDTPTRRTKEAA